MVKRSDPPTNCPEAQTAQELYLLMAFRKMDFEDRRFSLAMAQGLATNDTPRRSRLRLVSSVQRLP
jgi:hypothetical protein